ncbi:MAG: hypothetical protein ACTTHG_03810 [Treponemataceae bacterium]
MKKYLICIIYIIALLTISIIFFSCHKNDYQVPLTDVRQIQSTDIKTISKKNHRWYAFTYEGFQQVSLPQSSPQVLLKPWTEAIRISSAISVGTDGFMIVNKLGLLCCDPENEKQAAISYDNGIFGNLTADNMVNVDGYPVFHVYQNPEFSNYIISGSTKKQKANHPFLVQFHPESSVFLPLLSTDDLDFSDEVEVSDIIYNDNKWTATLKTSSDSSKDFEYITFSTYENLTDIAPNKRKDAIKTEEISEKEYREQFIPKNIKESPERVQALLSRLPQDFNFYIQCSVPNSGKQCSYVQNKDEVDGNIMESQVLLEDNFSIAVFTDGTGFFTGSLSDRYVLNEGRPIAFRLPKLPKNFSYGTIIVEKNILYVAWEESIFYEIGRTGFLTVDLAKVFYKD